MDDRIPDALMALAVQADAGMAIIDLTSPTGDSVLWANPLFKSWFADSDDSLIGQSLSESCPEIPVLDLLKSETCRFSPASSDLRFQSSTTIINGASGNPETATLKIEKQSEPDHDIAAYQSKTEELKQLYTAFADKIEAYRLSSLAAIHSRNIMIVMDPKGLILWVNQAFEEQTLFSNAEVVGTDPTEFIVQKGGDADQMGNIRALIERGEEGVFEVCAYKKSGDPYWFDIRLVPVRDENGAILQYVGVEQDLSLRENAELEMLTLEAHLESEKQRADFAVKALETYKTALDKHAIFAITDRKGRIDYANDHFCKISGYARDELIGQNHSILNSGAHDQAFFQNLWQTIARGETWQGEICNRNKSGELYWVDTTVFPIKDAEGRIQSYAAIRFDITDLKNSIAAADRANKLKSEFLANMSHEIRTPLNGVLGMAQLMERTDLDKRQTRYLETITSSGSALLSLINNILDISKVEAGLMETYSLEFSLMEAIEDVLTSSRGLIGDKPIELRQSVLCDADLPMVGDPDRTKQVLRNLVGNAIKFTEHGSITIEVSQPEPDSVRLAVIDTGIGIPADKLGHIFGRFNQADGSADRRYGGTGLGLAISKELVTMLGGEMGVESELGTGSTFWIRLPVDGTKASGDDADSVHAEIAA